VIRGLAESAINRRTTENFQYDIFEKSPFSPETETTAFSPQPFCHKSLNAKAARDTCLYLVFLLLKWSRI